jgi:hypothetical protein
MSMTVEQLKRESKAMIAFLKKLEKEEKELCLQNQILAREALTNGYSIESVLMLQPKQEITKKRKSPLSEKQDNDPAIDG